jgi:hypothetical protein
MAGLCNLRRVQSYVCRTRRPGGNLFAVGLYYSLLALVTTWWKDSSVFSHKLRDPYMTASLSSRRPACI